MMLKYSLALLTVLTCHASASDYFLNLKGEPVQGALIIAQTNAGASVKIDGKTVDSTEDGYFMFGFGRFDTDSKTLQIEYEGHRYTTTVPVKARDFPTERIDGLPPAKVNAPQENWERIKKEQAQVKQARSETHQSRYFLQGFIWPAPGRVSGVYGSRRILNGEPKRPHYGMDIANVTGTEVIAPAAGIVRMAEIDHYYTGGTIIIDHGYGLNSTYLHLSQVNVTVGQNIEQRDKIGEIGATGRATGPHLDWRINIGPSLRLDPQLIIAPEYDGETEG